MAGNEKEAVFPLEKMEILMDGFEALKMDYKEGGSLDFLNEVIRDGELVAQDLLLAAAPLRAHQLLYRSIQIDPEYKRFRRDWIKKVLCKKDRSEDWPWCFALAANYCAFDNPDQLLNAFNHLCRRFHYSGELACASDITLRKLNALKEEILVMNPNGFYFDFTSEKRSVILPPLSKDEIQQLSEIAETLLVHRLRYHHVQTEEEALKIIRFYQCVQNGHIAGYQNIRKEAAVTLIRKSLFCFKMTSSYLIYQKFMALSCEGKGASALGLFLEYKDILSRPMRYRTVFQQKPNSIRNYIDFVSLTPSRLCEGIAWSLRRGYPDVLFEFLNDKSTREIVDRKRFMYDLSEMLGSQAIEIAIRVCRQCIGRHVDVLYDRLAELRGKEVKVEAIDEDYSIPEAILVQKELDDWRRYYDDRGVILQVLQSQRPEHQEAHRFIMAMGYSHCLECAKVAVKTRKESFRLLDAKLKKHPDILKLLEEAE